MLSVAESTSLDSSGWKLDCAATQHICHLLPSFKDYLPFPVPKLLRVGKAEVFLRAVGEGTVELILQSGRAQQLLTLTGVWYCPDCPFNLLSTSRFVRAGHTIELSSAAASIHSPCGHHTLVLDMEPSGLYCCQPVAQPVGLPLPSTVAEGITAPVCSAPPLSEQGMLVPLLDCG